MTESVASRARQHCSTHTPELLISSPFYSRYNRYNCVRDICSGRMSKAMIVSKRKGGTNDVYSVKSSSCRIVVNYMITSVASHTTELQSRQTVERYTSVHVVTGVDRMTQTTLDTSILSPLVSYLATCSSILCWRLRTVGRNSLSMTSSAP